MGTPQWAIIMTQISFKLMTLSDIDGVVALERSCFDEPWCRKSFLEELENRVAYYLLAVADQAIIGYVGMWVIADEAQITNVAIAPDYRQQGIGARMMREAIRFAKEKQAKSMTLEVRPSNEAALALYHKMDFVINGLRKNYYDATHEDALIMWLTAM